MTQPTKQEMPMPNGMQDGMQLDPNSLIEVLQNKLAQATVREAQLESAVQSLLAENRALKEQIAMHEKVAKMQSDTQMSDVVDIAPDVEPTEG